MLLLALAGCFALATRCGPETEAWCDRDGDGVLGASDCDDADAGVFPGAPESWYDGVDQACDGGDDYDQDGDGHRPSDFGGEDCDDSDPARHPDAEETWYDGVDQDCAGDDDFDQDGDGYRHGEDDCDDLHADAHPGGVEGAECDGVDQDCDGVADQAYDADDDGWASCAGDCDDDDAAVNPEAVEACDGVDQDCDGVADEDFDRDGDGWATCAGDCDDDDAGVSPGEPDVLDGVDQDCSGVADDPAAEDVAIASVLGSAAAVRIDAGRLVIGSPADDGGGSDAGAVWAFSWGDLGIGVASGDAGLTLEGATGDEVGAALDAGLDWGSAGGADLLVGAPGADAVYVVDPDDATGAAHAASSLAWATLTGAAATDFGAAVLSAGDVDGDGADDVVVGAPGATSGKGAVYLFLGGSGAGSVSATAADHTIPGADAGDAIGAVLGGGGDTDGDGYDDVVIGVPGDDENGRSGSGSAFLVRGAALFVDLGLSVEAVAAWSVTGAAAGDAVGEAVAVADVASSDRADVLVTGDGGLGAFHGAVSGSESFSAADRRVTGPAVAVGGVSDLDGDGAPDLLLGGDGALFLFTLAGTSGALALPGDQIASWTAPSLATALHVADLDADGPPELAAAAADAVYLLDPH